MMIQYRPQQQALDLAQLHRQLCENLAAGHEVDAYVITDGVSSAVSDLAKGLLWITGQLFPPGPQEINWQTDPDDANLHYLIFTVAADGEFPAIRERQSRWHDEVESLVGPAAFHIRLSVYPR